MSKISSSRRGAFLSSFLISLRESCTELLVLLHYSCRHALEERACIAHWLAPTVEHRACKVWVNHWTLPQQPGPDSCLFWALSVDEVSGNSPVATNSTKHSTGEYLSLKMCIVFPSALLKIKSTSQHEGYSFFLDSHCQERWSYLREENIPISTSSPANGLLLLLNSGLLLWVYILILPKWTLKHI